MKILYSCLILMFLSGTVVQAETDLSLLAGGLFSKNPLSQEETTDPHFGVDIRGGENLKWLLGVYAPQIYDQNTKIQWTQDASQFYQENRKHLYSFDFRAGIVYKLPALEGIHPYLGGGLGFTHYMSETNVHLTVRENEIVSRTKTRHKDKENTFYPFGLVGVEVPVIEDMLGFVEIQYSFDKEFDEEFDDFLLVGGLRWRF